MFSSIRLIFTVLIISSIAGAGFYVMKLRSDNAILKANQIELEKSIEKQTQLLEKQKIDFEAILESNKKLNVLINTLKKRAYDIGGNAIGVYDYKEKKESEIKELKQNYQDFRNEIENNQKNYEKIIDEAAEEISSFVEKANLEKLS